MITLAHDPKYKFNGRDGSYNDAVVIREIWCENVYEVYDGDLSDTGIVVDIGANIGSFSMFAASLGAKKVIAVEPEPHNIEYLLMNIDQHKHHTPDCEFIHESKGIAGKSGFGFITNEEGGSTVTDVKEEGKTRIDLITLDQLFKRHKIEYIDVLKLDIEGLEGEVILGASEATMNLCRYITMEYDRHSNNLGAVVEKLNQTHQVKVVGKAGGMIFAKRY